MEKIPTEKSNIRGRELQVKFLVILDKKQLNDRELLALPIPMKAAVLKAMRMGLGLPLQLSI